MKPSLKLTLSKNAQDPSKSCKSLRFCISCVVVAILPLFLILLSIWIEEGEQHRNFDNNNMEYDTTCIGVHNIEKYVYINFIFQIFTSVMSVFIGNLRDFIAILLDVVAILFPSFHSMI